MIVNPCDMDIDARGRVWITEGANYRSSFQKWGILRPEGDRIVIMEDTNGDGAADKERRFIRITSINSALGICVLGNKVIVIIAPNVFVFTDTDGDDKADKREVLFTGISGFRSRSCRPRVCLRAGWQTLLQFRQCRRAAQASDRRDQRIRHCTD